MNLLHVMHVLGQNSLTSLFASTRRDRLHILAALEFPMATPSFVSHLSISCRQVIFSFLHFWFCVITEGSVSIQP